MIFAKKTIDKLLLGSFRRIQFIKKNSIGAILLEFACALPILILVLYFGLDVPRAYRFSAKLHKTSELYAQMLLNVTKKRTSKAITISDLKNISKSIGLTFSGIYSTNNGNCPFYLSTYIIAIKGGASNTFTPLWGVHIKNYLQQGNYTITATNDYLYSTITSSSTTHSGNINKLTIRPNEIKLLIETVAWYNDASRGFNKGLYLLTIPGVSKVSGTTAVKTFGDRTAVVSPPEGLISAQLPSS